MKSLIKICIVLISINQIANCQEMKEGFSFLENGQYAKAEVFFYNILKNYPNNKTARLCYGRAIGLNGKASEAFELFTNLLADYPNDFEVKLNYAESMLWNSKFKDAKNYYAKITSEQPNNFAALLGFANTLSNLKEYDTALIKVDKALKVSPDNPNAMISKKYIYLGYAYKSQQNEEFEKSETLLKSCLELFKDDEDALKNLANLYLIWKRYDIAQETYEQLALQQDQKTIALNGLSLVSHLKAKEKLALMYSNEALNRLKNEKNEKIVKETKERHVQALIWNKKFKPADSIIKSLIRDKPNTNWVLALRATLNIYKSNFKQSLEDYNQILKNDSTSFDGNLGKASVLKALGRPNEGINSAENTLKYYNNQKDALNFIRQINNSFSPSIETKISHTFDNGDNLAYAVDNALILPLSVKTNFYANHNYRTTENTTLQTNAVSNTLSLGLSYAFAPKISIKGVGGFLKTDNFTQFITDISLSINAMKLQNLEIGYKRQIESFNADLLNREIVQNNLYTNYNISSNFNLGWFTQYIYTFQNDDNTRHLLFTSLYYNLIPKPSVKAGINYQYITFSRQLPTIYFSPSRFNALEVFVNLIKDEAIAKPREFYYNATVAFGYQFIEDDDKLSAYRIQGVFGYRFSERAILNLYGTNSNIASAAASGGSGFRFTEIGLRFKWQFLNKPLFIKNKVKTIK